MLRTIFSIFIIFSFLLIGCAGSTSSPTPTPTLILTETSAVISTGTVNYAATELPASPTPAAGELTVFAASSLADVLPELEAGFLVSHPDVKFTFNFAGSQQLVQQLVQGAKADLFISADHKQIDTASQAGIITDGDAIPLAGNSLVVVTPFDNPGQIQNLLGLATPGIKLVIGAAEVPVGAYTLDFLDKAAANPDYGIDYKTQVLANVVSYEENVRAVLSKVILGEADAGIVYLTDALMAGPTQVTSLEIPQNLNIYATYWLAYLKESQQEILSHQFLEYLLSEEGQLILVMRGFLPVQ